jgi:hypothetical protein
MVMASRQRPLVPVRSLHPSRRRVGGLTPSQFNALITGELSARTGLGTRPIDDTDLDRLVAAGVDTFLRAFRARPAPNGPA